MQLTTLISVWIEYRHWYKPIKFHYEYITMTYIKYPLEFLSFPFRFLIYPPPCPVIQKILFAIAALYQMCSNPLFKINTTYHRVL